MSEAEPPDSKRLEAVQKLWDFARQLYQSKGIDIEKLLAKLAAKQEEQLNFPGARRDFTELCEAGCTPEVLGAIIFVLRVVPAIEKFWAFIVGHPERRRKLQRTLEATAQELDHFFPEVTDEANQEKLRTKLRARFAGVGHLHPSELASELRFYAGFHWKTVGASREVKGLCRHLPISGDGGRRECFQGILRDRCDLQRRLA
jgi:hypothetical protein